MSSRNPTLRKKKKKKTPRTDFPSPPPKPTSNIKILSSPVSHPSKKRKLNFSPFNQQNNNNNHDNNNSNNVSTFPVTISPSSAHIKTSNYSSSPQKLSQESIYQVPSSKETTLSDSSHINSDDEHDDSTAEEKDSALNNLIRSVLYSNCNFKLKTLVGNVVPLYEIQEKIMKMYPTSISNVDTINKKLIQSYSNIRKSIKRLKSPLLYNYEAGIFMHSPSDKLLDGVGISRHENSKMFMSMVKSLYDNNLLDKFVKYLIFNFDVL